MILSADRRQGNANHRQRTRHTNNRNEKKNKKPTKASSLVAYASWIKGGYGWADMEQLYIDIIARYRYQRKQGVSNQ